MPESPFLSELHPKSGRWAILEDDGRSAWLYLTIPGTQEICADCWIYNRVRAPAPAQIEEFRGGPPPADYSVASEQALVELPDEARMRFLWAEDGNSVAFILEDLALGFIAEGTKRGYSRHLLQTCPWGQPWDQREFQKVFGLQTG